MFEGDESAHDDAVLKAELQQQGWQFPATISEYDDAVQLVVTTDLAMVRVFFVFLVCTLIIHAVSSGNLWVP